MEFFLVHNELLLLIDGLRVRPMHTVMALLSEIARPCARDSKWRANFQKQTYQRYADDPESFLDEMRGVGHSFRHSTGHLTEQDVKQFLLPSDAPQSVAE